MRYKLFIFLLFLATSICSQNEVYLFKDIKNEYSESNITNANFKPVKKVILEKQTDATYWFKIPAYKTELDYIFRINNIRINKSTAFQNSKELQKMPNERYIAFKFDRNASVYIRVNSKFTAHYPFNLAEESVSNYNEKLQLIVNSFYYGFAFLVILYCFFYFYFFKDVAFVYYALLLLILLLGFSVMDGMWHFFMVDDQIIDFIILFNYIFLAFVSSKFVSSFLRLDNHFPKLERYTYLLGLVIILLVIHFLFFRIHIIFIIINILVFVILFIFWFTGILLFKNNIYTKIFVFAYVGLLFSGIDFFVLKNFGYSLFETNPTNMKIGGLIQIMVISVAVLYREKTLRASNYFMKNEIIKYSSDLEKLNISAKDESKKDNLINLSTREREIFDLIISQKLNKEIANTLNISVNTVKFHVKNIYEKLDIKSRKEAITIDQCST
jgi:DNA-binding CsgD family transcriptional regulator